MMPLSSPPKRTRFTALRHPSSVCALLGLGVALCIVSTSPLLAGCSASAPAASASEVRTPSRLTTVLRSEVARWEGTPYRLGGTTRRGIDCSAFMQRLYREALAVELPRSTRTQVREGRRVAKSDLRPGDLVFFRPARKVRHVGVYVGAGEFAHASTSEGVTITPLTNDYWEDVYWTARRVLRPAPLAAQTSTEAEEPSAEMRPPRVSERTGW